VEKNMISRANLGSLLVKLSIGLILVGFVMTVQPFLMGAYTYGFSVILAGVILFNIASHL
jgi:hypothetical protein